MNYSQNNEQNIILNYFKNYKGTLLDLGANDGITFSNSYADLIILIKASASTVDNVNLNFLENSSNFCINFKTDPETHEVESS